VSPFGRSAAGKRVFRVAVYPAGVTRWANPYFRLFHAALARHGIEAVDEIQIDSRWLREHAAHLDAVHLHWPERIWQRKGLGAGGRVRRAIVACWCLIQMRHFLRTAGRLGLKRIWTVHNLEPHEGAFRWDRYAYRLVARETDLVVCHSRSALEAVRRLYPPRGAALVMPIGDEAGDYPPPRPREQVLLQLGLDPRVPMVCCLGRLRHYKGVELACEAIAAAGGRLQLVIGGVRHAGFDASPIRALAQRIRGVVLIERRLSTQEYADVMGASEAMLLPYRQITGSAALLSALGFARGVVASDLPFFREILAGEPDAGVLVPTRDAAAWAASTLDYLARRADLRSAAALRLAARYSWDRCVEPMVAALLAAAAPAADPGGAETMPALAREES
jgi:glycosyltransferase involved in cell wall biosynthesis